jgi:hypothetical protein
VDSAGNTLEFLLSATRAAEAAKQVFHKTRSSAHTVTPRVLTVDKNPATPSALADLKSAGVVLSSCDLRQVKDLNHIVEQDQRFIKRLVKPGLGFWSVGTAWNTLQGYAREAHDSEGADARGGKRGECLPVQVHCPSVWSGCVSRTASEWGRPLCSFKIFCNKAPS